MRIVAVVGAVAAAAVLVGCDVTADGRAPKRDSANLRALKDDPLARYQPPGGRLIDSSESNEGMALGKPRLAQYSLMFELPPGDPEKQLQHAVNAALAAGWAPIGDLHPYRGSQGALVESADKQLPSGGAHVGLTMFPKGPPSDETNKPVISIWLRHLGS